MSFEVEQKFKVTADTRPRLLLLGAELGRRWSFTDVYYDSPGHELMLKAYWLRKRNGQWQLKVDTKTAQNEPSSVIICRETDNEEEILEMLQEGSCLCSTSWHGSGTTLDGLVSDGVLVAVAEFTTERESYVFKDKEGGGGGGGGRYNGVRVELDHAAGIGHSVGEVELMVGGRAEFAEAERTVKALAAELGQVSQAPGSKLSAYLSLHQPLLLQQLIAREAITGP